MQNLIGKDILIGKEPGNGRLMLCLEADGKTKAAFIGSTNSVPSCVSRCKPDQKIAHVRLTVEDEDKYRLVNLKNENVTYVNDSQIVSKLVNRQMKVELGCDRYRIDLETVIEAARRMVSIPGQQPEPKVKTFSASHLDGIWNSHNEAVKALGKRQRQINLTRSLCGIFTMCAVPCAILFGPVGYVLTGIGVIGNVYSFVGMKNDNTPEERERLDEEFQEKYICPNPECGKYLPRQPYKWIMKQYSASCPFCKCKYTD